jgi:hypothetical protein
VEVNCNEGGYLVVCDKKVFCLYCERDNDRKLYLMSRKLQYAKLFIKKVKRSEC